MLGKQGDGLTLLAGATGSTDTVDIIFDGEGELEGWFKLVRHHA